MQPVNIDEKLSQINEIWTPKIVATMNNYHIKLAKFHGEFTWHRHIKTDEVFIVIKGEMEIHFRTKSVKLRQGEMLVVPKGVEHKPSASELCEVMLIEPEGTVNTGSTRNEYTVDNFDWI